MNALLRNYVIFSARGTRRADFIQPSLVQLQPNLDDFMDTFEPLQGNQIDIYHYYCVLYYL